VFELPVDGSVPFLPGWRWVATPGHSPGHVSFFRESDRLLIAGDAFVTTKQESLLSVLAQTKAVFGPPKYFTHDWQQAEESVRLLAGLRPEIAATGHGTPMRGEELRQQLQALVEQFRERAVPPNGRYADSPVVYTEHGPVSVPPRKGVPLSAISVAAVVVLGLFALLATRHGDRDHND
jgi:glyoxylase-like metal-dependent hydrolase (beta-lactamase superfamily II)